MIMSSTESSVEVFQPAASPLVKYVEVWLPEEDQQVLTCRYSALADSGVRESEKRHAGLGEGLAGAAWKQKAATILQETPSDLMETLNAEVGASLSAFVAIPLFRKQDLQGVVVLGVSGAEGAVEIWSRDDRDELAVTSGHYKGLPSFEFITRYTRFPKGAGLPGTVWKTGRAQLAQDLEKSSGFIRSFGKDPAVITSAVGLPIFSQRGFPASVLLLLSARDAPLAGMTQLWNCDSSPADGGATVASVSGCSTIGGLSTSNPTGWQREVMSRLNQEGRPLLLSGQELSLPGGANFNLSMPVYRQDELCNVLNMMF